MAQAPSKRSKRQSGWTPVAIIGAITDSVERIGADNAFYGTIITLSFVCFVCGTNIMETLAWAFGLIAAWLLIKFANVCIENWRQKLVLARIREQRGLKLIEVYSKSPNQIARSDRND